MNRPNANIAALLFLLFLVIVTLRTFSQPGLVLGDPDLYWHLRTGEWIVQNHAIPHTDPFSVFGAGKPWVSYCWLYDLIVYGFYDAFGLAGLCLFQAIMWVLIFAELASILHRLQPSLLLTFVLCMTGYLGLSHQYTPRPWLFSMLLMLLVLDIVLTAGRRKTYRLLLFLPLIFLFWTMLHAQFFNGLLVLGTVLVESVAVRFVRLPAVLDEIDTIPLGPMAAAFLASVAGTFATPYGYHVYEAMWELGTETRLWNVIVDHMSMSFRLVSEWIVLAITLVAAMTMFLFKPVRLFLLLTYLGGVVCAFRGARDSWLVVFPALIILARSIPVPNVEPLRLGWVRLLGIGVAALGTVFLLGRASLPSDRLEAIVAEEWPQQLADFVTEQGYAGPLANPHNWGGYLMWRLRTMPVGIDQRTTVYHEDRVMQHCENWSGMPGWENDPDLCAANVVIVPHGYALAQLLVRDPRFKKVFEDKKGAVFVAVPANSSQPITP